MLNNKNSQLYRGSPWSSWLSLIPALSLLFHATKGWGQSTNNTTPTPLLPQEKLDIPGTIIVQKFEFIESTVFSEAELNKVTAEFIGKPVTFAQLLQAANKVTELYASKGYITSGAYIPSQETQSGIIKIQILEGSLSEIKVDVIKGRLNPDYVRSRLAVATRKPLNINRLQEALQLLQLNPLITSLDAELAAGIKPGTNTLEVKVEGARSFSSKFIIDNYRNPSVGSFERRVEISEGNLLGLGDGLSFAYSNTDGSNRFEGSYTLPVNPRNGTLSFDYQVTNNNIITPAFRDLNIEVDSREFGLTYRQPVIQRATPQFSQELVLSLGVARKENNSELLGVNFPLFPGADVNGETRISQLSFTQELLQRSRQSVLAARFEFNLGVGAFDATINNTQPDSQFFLWRGQMLYLRRLGEVTSKLETAPSLLLRSNIQLAADSLLSREQFSVGGQATVRGYRQDSLITDNGLFASIEGRLPMLQVPGVKGTLQVAPFIDFGTGWNTGRRNPNFNTLLGTGFGLLWQMGDNFTARVDWGIPLISTNFRGRTWQDNGVYFRLEYKPF